MSLQSADELLLVLRCCCYYYNTKVVSHRPVLLLIILIFVDTCGIKKGLKAFYNLLRVPYFSTLTNTYASTFVEK